MRPTNRREYYRIPFPPSQRPRWVVGASINEVLDCSERGLRYRPADGVPPPVGARVEGRLRFPRGVEVYVQGEVIRATENRISLRLSGTGVPYSVIFQEQIYLRSLTR